MESRKEAAEVIAKDRVYLGAVSIHPNASTRSRMAAPTVPGEMRPPLAPVDAGGGEKAWVSICLAGTRSYSPITEESRRLLPLIRTSRAWMSHISPAPLANW